MPRRRLIVRLLLATFLLWFGLEVFHVAVGRNFHAVLPDRIYRSAQLSPDQLDNVVDEYGIRTVVNLRGFCQDHDWYRIQCQATQRRNLNQEDLTLSAARLPPTSELRRLIEILDEAEYPLLFHCRRGADRTGLASGVAMLLCTDGGLTAARWKAGPRYGHLGIGPASQMDRFFDLYEDFLKFHEIDHDPDIFRHWALKEYTPGAASAELSFVKEPTEWQLGQSIDLSVVAKNTSTEVWRMRPGTGDGVHARYHLCDVTGQMVYEGQAGLFDRQIPPGESITLKVALPPPPGVGDYVLIIDMIDTPKTGSVAFRQVGSEPLIRTIRVRD